MQKKYIYCCQNIANYNTGLCYDCFPLSIENYSTTTQFCKNTHNLYA